MADVMATKMLLVVLFVFFLSKINYAKTNDVKQFGTTIFNKYDERILTNIFNINPESFRIRSRRQLTEGTCGSCGIANIEKKIRVSIINGDDVDPPYKYPWTVAVKVNGNISCTGTIINEYFILTAAHCLKKDVHKYEVLKPRRKPVSYIRPSEVSVSILKRDDLPVKSIIPHSQFTVSEWKHDIALLKLRGRIFCNRFVRPICLPSSNFALPSDAVLTISGFGSDTGHGDAIDHLKEAKVTLVGLPDCPFPRHLMDGTYYCVKGLNYGRKQTPCYGDSGGPMIYQPRNKFYLVGVASFSKQCDINEPFLYTSADMHLEWIYRNARPSNGTFLSGAQAFAATAGEIKARDETEDSGESEIGYKLALGGSGGTEVNKESREDYGRAGGDYGGTEVSEKSREDYGRAGGDYGGTEVSEKSREDYGRAGGDYGGTDVNEESREDYGRAGGDYGGTYVNEESREDYGRAGGDYGGTEINEESGEDCGRAGGFGGISDSY